VVDHLAYWLGVGADAVREVVEQDPKERYELDTAGECDYKH
jgi:RNA:NAD 2'-phosphotransferase (TPT1/KptA family)